MDRTVKLTPREWVQNELHWQRSRMRERRDGFWRWIAWHLPRQVVYHATIRAWVFSLSGKHGHQQPTEVHTFETVKRWDEEDH